MSLACRDHCKDTGPKGAIGHDGSDGCKYEDRLNRYGRTNGISGENISYGCKEGRAVLI